jgi:hypothetical protein
MSDEPTSRLSGNEVLALKFAALASSRAVVEQAEAQWAVRVW